MRAGLLEGKKLLESNGCGSVYPKHRVMLLITDGVPNRGGNMQDLLDAAKTVRDAGIHIIAIGVGPTVNLNVLKDITNDMNSVFPAADFFELLKNDFIKPIIHPICTMPSTFPPTTTTQSTYPPTTTTKSTYPPTTTTKYTYPTKLQQNILTHQQLQQNILTHQQPQQNILTHQQLQQNILTHQPPLQNIHTHQ